LNNVQRPSAQLILSIVVVLLLVIGLFYWLNDDTADRVPAATGAAPIAADAQTEFASLQAQAELVVEPASPAAWFHNALLHQQRGDTDLAKPAFEAYRALHLEYIDPYLAYVDLLTQSEGTVTTRQQSAAWQNEQPTSNALALVNATLLETPVERLAALQKLTESAPTYGPSWAELVAEYQRSLDQLFTRNQAAAQAAAWEQLQNLDQAEDFLAYYLDRTRGEQRWAAASEAVAATAAQSQTLPLAFTPYFGSTSVTVDVTLPEQQVKELRYRLDATAPLSSTGWLTGGAVNLSIGPLPLPTEPQRVEIQYVDVFGVESPLYSYEYSAAEIVVNAIPRAAANRTEGYPVLFTVAVPAAQVGELYTYTYSLDSQALDQRILGLGTGAAIDSATLPPGEHMLYIQAAWAEQKTTVVEFPFVIK